MSRYQRKSNRKLVFTEENLADAKRKIEEGMSQRQVAVQMNINESTLRKRLKSGTVPTSLGRFKNTFPDLMEKELAQQVRDLDQRFYGITKKNLQMVAFRFAESNNIPHNFNKVKQMVGESWITGFCQRHKITLRQPEKCSVTRAMGFNPIQVGKFFDNLMLLYESRKYTPDAIYNMDETGLSTVPNKLPKVLTSKGKKLVGKVSSAERGQLVTAVCCMSASGCYIPPALIFPRKRMKDDLYMNSPSCTLKLISDSGFINVQLFCEWLIHFKTHSKPSADHPVLLILDNHSSHRDLEAIKYCRENYIDLLSLPPHASHKMQPLDIGFFGPLKRAYSQECDKWMVSNPGKVITQMQVSGLFGKAYAGIANIEKAQKSFEASGIFPYNNLRFTETDFAPSLVTDVPIENRDHNLNSIETKPVGDDSNILGIEANISDLESSVQPLTNLDLNALDIICDDGTLIKAQKESTCSTGSDMAVSIMDILPLPQVDGVVNTKKARNQKSEILSSTPYKDELEKRVNEKNSKEKAKQIKACKRKVTVEECKEASSATPKIKKEMNKKKKKSILLEEVFNCPGCGEKYSSPPVEDWIMCAQCQNWWHESCSTYVLGEFICDNCV